MNNNKTTLSEPNLYEPSWNDYYSYTFLRLGIKYSHARATGLVRIFDQGKNKKMWSENCIQHNKWDISHHRYTGDGSIPMILCSLRESFAQCRCLHRENRGLLWRQECSFEGQCVCVCVYGSSPGLSWSVRLREIPCVEVCVSETETDEVWLMSYSEMLNLLKHSHGMLISFGAVAEWSVCSRVWTLTDFLPVGFLFF